MPHKTNDFTASLLRCHRQLHRWYAREGRVHLPWRNTPDAYAIYISEIMLQQTQVKTVLERYYEPFLKHFPTLAALAKAERSEVLKVWEGLGYYRRAANMHMAAQQAGGTLPNTVEGLLALPGIGRNTAHAVACFAYKAVVPIMEANVKRVLYRVFALKSATDEKLWELATKLLDSKQPFNYNQVMMDIGAMVCTRSNPRCDVCPLQEICEGKTSPLSYPAPKTKKIVPVRERRIVVCVDELGRYYLARRETKFLGGLYGFPEFGVDEKVIIAGKIYALSRPQIIGRITQSYSHFTLHATVWRLQVEAKLIKKDAKLQKVILAEIKALPLSRADQKILQLLPEDVR